MMHDAWHSAQQTLVDGNSSSSAYGSSKLIKVGIVYKLSVQDMESLYFIPSHFYQLPEVTKIKMAKNSIFLPPIQYKLY